MKSVSVVITAYNRPDFLRESLASALAQTYAPSEIIVVDDCSPTDLGEVVHSFNDPRIQYYKSEKNSGANHSRNVGVDKAVGDLIAFLDDDDIWLPSKLEEQVSLFENDGCIGVLCAYEYLENGKAMVVQSGHYVDESLLKTGNPYCGMSGLVVNAKSVKKLRLDESLPCGQDWDLYVRLFRSGLIFYVSKPLFRYRFGGHDGISTASWFLNLESFDQRLSSIEKHKSWLGKSAYKKRIAEYILYSLLKKRNKMKWVQYSLNRAGFVATTQALFLAVVRVLKRWFSFYR